MEFPKKDPRVAHFVRHFSGYRGRKPVRIRGSQSYHVSDYWSEGSRVYSYFINPHTGAKLSDSEVGFEAQERANPFKLRMGSAELSPNVAVVENSIFCGKNMGIRVVMHPDTYQELQTKWT